MSRRKTVILTDSEPHTVVGVLAKLYAEHRTWDAVAATIGEGSAPYWRYVALGKRDLNAKTHRALNKRVGHIVLGEL